MGPLFVVVAALLAAPADGTRERVLVLDLEADAALAGDAAIVSGAVAEAAASDVVVVTSADLRTLSDLAADRQSCGLDSTACLAELAGAVDVHRVVHGRLSRVDGALLVQLSTFDTTTSEGARVSFSGDSVRALLDDAPGRVHALLVPPAPSFAGPVVVGAGAAVALGTVVAGLVFNQTLADATTSTREKDDAALAGRATVVVGSVVAAGLVATGVALWVLE